MFIVAGCYGKYRPLGDIFSIDFSSLIETGSTDGFKWKQW